MKTKAMAWLVAGTALMVSASYPVNAWTAAGTTTFQGGGGSSGITYGGASGGYSAWSHGSSQVYNGGGVAWVGGYYPSVAVPYGSGYTGSAAAAQVNSFPTPDPQAPSYSGQLPIGAKVPQLPGNCGNVTVRDVEYYQCGPNWFKPYFGSSSVYYQAVHAPE
ncbi:MAG: hypothetical protein NTX45_30275 [Proteobacteria bacterium]|nr:hypothetical protein [Pseudomonadota bacterium]